MARGYAMVSAGLPGVGTMGGEEVEPGFNFFFWENRHFVMNMMFYRLRC